jgi:tetratricopeptide (TPR) repeat protein
MAFELLPQGTIDSLCSRIRKNELIVLVGAGISYAPPSCAPLFRPLRDQLLHTIVESLDGHLPKRIVSIASQLFDASKYPRSPSEPVPEVLFESLHTVLKGDLFSALRILLADGAPNPQHQFLAALFGRGIRLLITTNFEDCFEQALRRAGREFAVCADEPSISSSMEKMANAATYRGDGFVWKVHGTLDQGREETIRVTLEQVAREKFVKGKFNSLVQATKTWPLLVLGYSGYDLDVSRALIAAAEHGQEIFWLSRERPGEHDPCQVIVKHWGDRGRLLIGPMDRLFSRLAAGIGEGQDIVFSTGSCADMAATRKHKLRQWADGLSHTKRLGALMLLFHRLTKYQAALELADLLEKTPAVDGEPPGASLALLFRFGILRDAQEYEKARKALKVFIASGFSGDPEAVLLMNHELAVLAVSESDFDTADEIYGNGLEDARRRREREFERLFSHSWAVSYSRRGRFDEAFPLFRRALQIAEEDGTRNQELITRHELGIIAFERKDFPGASQEFSANLTAAREIGDLRVEQGTLFELGIIALSHQRNLEEAKRLFEQAHEIAGQLGQMRSQARCRLYLSEVLQEGDNHREAKAEYTKCIAISKRLRDSHLLATSLARRARSRFALDDLDGGKRDLAKAKKIAQQSSHTMLLAEIEHLERAVSEFMAVSARPKLT